LSADGCVGGSAVPVLGGPCLTVFISVAFTQSKDPRPIQITPRQPIKQQKLVGPSSLQAAVNGPPSFPPHPPPSQQRPPYTEPIPAPVSRSTAAQPPVPAQ